MFVSKVWFNKYESGKLQGFANISFALKEGGNGCITIKGFKLFKKDDEDLWVALPSSLDKNGEWQEIIKIDIKNSEAKDFKELIEKAVIAEYKGVIAPTNTIKNKETNDTSAFEADDDIPF